VAAMVVAKGRGTGLAACLSGDGILR
jgi:hypothetical protein